MNIADRLPWIGAALAFVAAVAPAQTPPTVTSLQPAAGAIDIELRDAVRLVVTFDQDMDPDRHAIGAESGGMPTITREGWTDARTYALQIEPEDDRLYSLILSPCGTPGFATAKGERLPATAWRFATRGAPLDPGVGARCATALFRVIREQYVHRDRLGVDWAQLEHQHADAFTKARCGASLAAAVADVLAAAQDPQILVRWNDRTATTFARQADANDDAGSVARLLGKPQPIGALGAYLRTRDGIGYLAVNSLAREQTRSFDKLLQTLRDLLDCKGLVLDLRTCTDGDEALARRLAAFFVDGDRVFAMSRSRDATTPAEFTDPQERRLRGNGAPDAFGGPVILLQGQLNMGVAESFVLMMKQSPRTTTIGDRTYGTAGEITALQLAPGLVITLPTVQLLRTDGSMFAGEGIAPHIHVDTGRSGSDDPVLVEALQRLHDAR